MLLLNWKHCEFQVQVSKIRTWFKLQRGFQGGSTGIGFLLRGVDCEEDARGTELDRVY